MTTKGYSMVGKPVLFGFLVVLLMAVSSQPASAVSNEELPFNKNPKLSLNVGLTLARAELLEKQPHINVLMKIHLTWLNPQPEPPWPEFVLEVGYNEFKFNAALPGVMTPDKKFNWWNVNPTICLTFGKSNLKPFISAGPGVYFPKEGNARFGFKGGLGFDYQISEKFMLEIGADYHFILLKDNVFWGNNTDFFHTHVGFVVTL